jgi:cysteine desulfurase
MFKRGKKQIYLDNASSTPCSHSVVKKMLPYFSDIFYNPSGIYTQALQVQKTISENRSVVAKILKVQPEEIYFVDGATEGNNMILIGIIREWKKNNPLKQPHIITSCIDHAAVIETCKYLEKEKVSVTYLGVDAQGYISLKELKESITRNTVLISVGYVNGEIGTIQDIKGIIKIIRHFRKHHNSLFPYVHTDAVQAINYVDEIGIPQLGLDAMTFNASKIYGPKKIAVLFVRKNMRLEPLLFGGNQERGLRSGTENVPYIIGLTQAFVETRYIQKTESKRLAILQKKLQEAIAHYDNQIIFNSCAELKISNIINITIPNLSHEEIVIRLDFAGFMCSVKSACKTGEDGDSHVIKALRNTNTGSLRISLGRDTTKKDLDGFMQSFIEIVEGMKLTYEKLIK